MTTTPAPRRGLFFVRTFPHFRGLFLCDFLCRFGLFYTCTFLQFRPFLGGILRQFRPFLGGILRQFRRLFLCCFLLCLQARRARSPRAARAGSREGQSGALFLCPFLSRFGHPVAPAKPHKQRPERHQTRARVRVRISSFFLCLYCAISVPPWLPIATHSNTPEAMKNPGIKPFLAKYRGLQIGGR